MTRSGQARRAYDGVVVAPNKEGSACGLKRSARAGSGQGCRDADVRAPDGVRLGTGTHGSSCHWGQGKGVEVLVRAQVGATATEGSARADLGLGKGVEMLMCVPQMA